MRKRDEEKERRLNQQTQMIKKLQNRLDHVYKPGEQANLIKDLAGLSYEKQFASQNQNQKFVPLRNSSDAKKLPTYPPQETLRRSPDGEELDSS